MDDSPSIGDIIEIQGKEMMVIQVTWDRRESKKGCRVQLTDKAEWLKSHTYASDSNQTIYAVEKNLRDRIGLGDKTAGISLRESP